MFIFRLLSLPSKSVFRQVFIFRFFQILTSGIFTNRSPTAQILEICTKYKIVDVIQNTIMSGILPPKESWKKIVKKLIDDKDFAAWRFDLKLHSKLGLFRTIVLKNEPCIWWDMTKMFRPMKNACCTMLRLLYGCNCLRF